MKHIFKKLHFGSNHEAPNRSNELAGPSTPNPCASDHRSLSVYNSGNSPASPSSASPPPVASTSGRDGASRTPASAPVGNADERLDYFSSEEEFQVQLALAISASSNADFRDDPDKDQIRAATLLSLGRSVNDSIGKNESAEALSRRYWDYNVLDYGDKVLDGFYDVYGISTDPASQGKIPSLADLQATLGDLGFEIVIVNRAIDPALEEMEQVARCVSLDCPVVEVGLLNSRLVQKIADLVSEHMGGPVRDASDMLARWMERSTEVRTSLQTSVLPIGYLNVGLSRHRALLFKVLADSVGIPCRLVKGSHYTGIDDDAINIIKSENEREFLVDLMAAPGTLIPADILSTKDAHSDLHDMNLSNNQIPWTAFDHSVDLSRMDLLDGHHRTSNGKSTPKNDGIINASSSSEKAILIPGVSIGNGSGGNSKGLIPANQSSSNQKGKPGMPVVCDGGREKLNALPYPRDSVDPKNLFPDLNNGSLGNSKGLIQANQSSNQKGKPGMPVVFDGGKEKLNAVPYSQDNVDPKNLFADLNPFLIIGAGKTSMQNNPPEKKINDFHRHGENISSGPGRPSLPVMRKNRAACNEVPRENQQDFMDGLFPRKNIEGRDFNAPSVSTSSSTISPGTIGSLPSPAGDSLITLRTKQRGSLPSINDDPEIEKNSLSHDGIFDRTANMRYVDEHSDGEVVQNNAVDGIMEHDRNINKHDRRKCTYDRFMGPTKVKELENANFLDHSGPSRLDPMLEDVAEWEILWEDLVIGERIGLGSYGEVYHADWNGTEVAVKKFLDQDFSGDALEEFRSEVRIMRRLRHPNVVLFMGAVTRPPNLSIVTEFLPRGSLYRILHRPNCQIDEKRRIKMALDVARGMSCLHSSTPTIVHRDLKSPNLLVDKNWNVKVCDFGLSRLKHNTFLSSKSTAGTPEWMAPEVLRNEPSNEKCDVYSFGIILWELATLRMPWSGMNPMQVVGAVGFQNRRLDIPKEVDPLVARIIWECWQTEPSLRPSFAQLTSALKPLQQLVISPYTDAQSSLLPQEISVNSTP